MGMIEASVAVRGPPGRRGTSIKLGLHSLGSSGPASKPSFEKGMGCNIKCQRGGAQCFVAYAQREHIDDVEENDPNLEIRQGEGCLFHIMLDP